MSKVKLHVVSKLDVTKACGRDKNGGIARFAPLWLIGVLEFEVSSTAQATIKESHAQRSRVHSVTLAVQISIPTSSSYSSRGIAFPVIHSSKKYNSSTKNLDWLIDRSDKSHLSRQLRI
ncbi:hypothetical protein TB2_032000 [Malus domestica]